MFAVGGRARDFDAARFQNKERAANIAFVEKNFPRCVGPHDERLKEMAEFAARDAVEKRDPLQEFALAVKLGVDPNVFEPPYHPVESVTEFRTTSMRKASSSGEMARGGKRTITSPKGRSQTPRRMASSQTF